MTSAISARLLIAHQLEALENVDWTVVSGDRWGDAPDHLDVAEVPMRREPALADLLSFVRLFRFFRRHRFSIVQTHTPKASMLALPAARLAGQRPVYTVHGSLYFADNSRAANIAGWVFERWCCTWARLVLVQSREDARMLPQARICAARKIRYVGNGIRLDRFQPSPLPPATDRPTVLMISRLVAEKGCRDFLKVASALRNQARFVHVGPEEHDQNDALTPAELAVASATGVEFVGEVADVRPYIADAHLVLLPSYREGIPRAAMEAAAMGRPVVAYDVRGVREVVHPATGLLVGRGDVGALTALTRELVGSPDRLETAAQACAALGRDFGEERVIARLKAVYAELGIS